MKHFFIIALLFGLSAGGCTDAQNRTTGVYILLDTSGTSALELKKAQSIVNYLLGTLQPKDTLAVACIDTGRFSEKDIVAKMTFDQRPSLANNQKRAVQRTLADFVATAKSSFYTDISGGILQAIEYLNEAGAGQKYILIFSDLQEELAEGHVCDVPFQLTDFNVIAFNVTRLRQDIREPGNYLDRVEQWRFRVESGKGKWRVVNDLERLDGIFSR